MDDAEIVAIVRVAVHDELDRSIHNGIGEAIRSMVAEALETARRGDAELAAAVSEIRGTLAGGPEPVTGLLRLGLAQMVHDNSQALNGIGKQLEDMDRAREAARVAHEHKRKRELVALGGAVTIAVSLAQQVIGLI